MKKKIMIMKNGVSVGFVKSISEEKNTFTITKNKDNAKGYTNEDIIHKEIDVLTRISSEKELDYVFLYI